LHSGSAVGDDGTEKDWGKCEEVFNAYAGTDKDMENKEFAKFCKENKLLGHGFAKHDVDLIWTQVCPKGKRKIHFEEFMTLVRHIAKKRNQSNGEIQTVVEQSGGPVLHATKTDAVRFFDDKSTFTGAHAHNAEFGDCGADAQVGRHDRNKEAAAEHDAQMLATADEGKWAGCQDVFMLFAGDGGELDGREFVKMCSEVTGVLGKSFRKEDVDIVFAAAAHGKKKMQFPAFKEAVIKIADKKKCGVGTLQDSILASDGPKKTGVTKASAGQCRFHDDQSTYTGAHADVHGRGGHGEDRHDIARKEKEALEAGSENEHDWTEALKGMHKFCSEGPPGLLGKDFTKLCTDAGLYDGKFTKNDVDVVFVGAAGGRGVHKLTDDMFMKACRNIAKKKHCETYQVQSTVANCRGPELHATKAEYSKFHDDESTYTGSHVKD